jgi:hypothetical protein
MLILDEDRSPHIASAIVHLHPMPSEGLIQRGQLHGLCLATVRPGHHLQQLDRMRIRRAVCEWCLDIFDRALELQGPLLPPFRVVRKIESGRCPSSSPPWGPHQCPQLPDYESPRCSVGHGVDVPWADPTGAGAGPACYRCIACGDFFRPWDGDRDVMLREDW